MISPRAVAIQGLGYGPLLTAVQGLLPIAEVQPSGGGGFFRPRTIRVRSRRRDDDEEIFLIILAALHVLND